MYLNVMHTVIKLFTQIYIFLESGSAVQFMQCAQLTVAIHRKYKGAEL